MPKATTWRDVMFPEEPLVYHRVATRGVGRLIGPARGRTRRSGHRLGPPRLPSVRLSTKRSGRPKADHEDSSVHGRCSDRSAYRHRNDDGRDRLGRLRGHRDSNVTVAGGRGGLEENGKCIAPDAGATTFVEGGRTRSRTHGTVDEHGDRGARGNRISVGISDVQRENTAFAMDNGQCTGIVPGTGEGPGRLPSGGLRNDVPYPACDSDMMMRCEAPSASSCSVHVELGEVPLQVMPTNTGGVGGGATARFVCNRGSDPPVRMRNCYIAGEQKAPASCRTAPRDSRTYHRT